MGLDVYLYRSKDLKELKRRQLIAEEFSTEVWSEKVNYNDYTDSEKDDIRTKVKLNEIELGLHDGGEWAEEKIELPSTLYPEHYFKIGYFRSSYNDGGINHILRNMGITDLNEIFEAGDNYMFEPENWAMPLVRVNRAIEALDSAPAVSVTEFGPNMFKTEQPITDAAKALQAYLKEREKYDENPGKGFDSYSNNVGDFFMKDPIKVHAVIEGIGLFGKPCIYAITDVDYTFYKEALKIVKETIEYVLAAKGDGYQYYFHWSG